jgi:hypothetical protein
MHFNLVRFHRWPVLSLGTKRMDGSRIPTAIILRQMSACRRSSFPVLLLRLLGLHRLLKPDAQRARYSPGAPRMRRIPELLEVLQRETATFRVRRQPRALAHDERRRQLHGLLLRRKPEAK